jgi:Uncharacterised protein family UPF0102
MSPVVCTTSDSPSPQPASSRVGAHADGMRPPDDTATPSAPRREDTRRALGQLGERLAAEHLERLGFAIVARNARTRHGEIDLVAFDGHTLCFNNRR